MKNCFNTSYSKVTELVIMQLLTTSDNIYYQLAYVTVLNIWILKP